MHFLLDTVTIIRHFAGSGRVGRCALNILHDANNHFLVSTVSLMEVLYLSEKKRIDLSLSDTISMINSSSYYSIVDLSADVIKMAETITFPELHDRLILATAKLLNIPIISSDKEFEKVPDIEVIWE